ncbi:MAG TPA: hypothetical protein VJN71_02095 [Nitrososphaerales archaeon]|nr:hypothetical protein [Nitrososphaerales archaeon]
MEDHRDGLQRKRSKNIHSSRVNKQHDPKIRTISSALQMEEHDLELLKEYGFRPRTMKSASMNKKKIDAMNMRQLDRVKMLLLRNSALCEGYPEEVRRGITQNNLLMYSKALALLANFFL